MKIKFLSAIFIPWSKWLLKNGYINIWLTGWLVAEWMNEGLNFFSLWKLLHFLLCQWAIFWSYSKKSRMWVAATPNLSLINLVQPREDLLPHNDAGPVQEFLGYSVSEPRREEAIFSKPIPSVRIYRAPSRSQVLF